MKNPIAKIVIAAIVVAACITALTMWTGTGSSVALADVLTRIQQVSVYRYQMSATVTGQMATETPIDQDVRATILISQDYGMKLSTETTDPNGSSAMLQEMYMLPVQDQKDPAYYGDIVTPEDEDQVLMRWKVSDTEYRVIFGSLHIENVTADVLAELEKNLPK